MSAYFQYKQIIDNPNTSNFNHYQDSQLEISEQFLNAPSISSANIGGGKVVWIDNLLSPDIINDLLSLYETLNFFPVGQDGNAKNWHKNSVGEATSFRASIYNKQFAKILSEKLDFFLQPFILERHFTSNVSTQCELNKVYSFLGINPYFRLVNYNHDSQLKPHYDGHFHFRENIQTMMTCLIYLNDCESGQTTFLRDTTKFPFLDEEELMKVEVKAGRILLFDQNLLHTTQPTMHPKKLIFTDYIMGY